jgi:hypothetical protein
MMNEMMNEIIDEIIDEMMNGMMNEMIVQINKLIFTCGPKFIFTLMKL